MSKNSPESPEQIKRNLLNQAENLFGRDRSMELEPEIEVMATQLALLRATPMELQDEP